MIHVMSFFLFKHGSPRFAFDVLRPIIIYNWVICHVISYLTANNQLGGGFKHLLFSPLLGEMIQFD